MIIGFCVRAESPISIRSMPPDEPLLHRRVLHFGAEQIHSPEKCFQTRLVDRISSRLVEASPGVHDLARSVPILGLARELVCQREERKVVGILKSPATLDQ